MKNANKILAVVLVALSAAACKKDPENGNAKTDFAAEGYSFCVKDDGKYIPADKVLSVKEMEYLSLYVTFEKHPGSLYPAEFGEIEYKIAKNPDASVAFASPIRTGSVYLLEIKGISEGKTGFTAEVTSAGDGKLLLRKSFDVEVAAICEAVDLGLSVKWAPFNVGATAPEEYGSYFAWGETKKKENFDWSKDGDYKWGVYDSSDDTPEHGMTKYTNGDGLAVLSPEDDPATANWGKKWRTPTIDEAKELLDETKCTWVWDNKQNGCYVISKITNNSIFLPAGGRCEGTQVYNKKSRCDFWLANLSEFNPSYAYHFSGGITWEDKFTYNWTRVTRYYGHTVRAVKEY